MVAILLLGGIILTSIFGVKNNKSQLKSAEQISSLVVQTDASVSDQDDPLYMIKAFKYPEDNWDEYWRFDLMSDNSLRVYLFVSNIKHKIIKIPEEVNGYPVRYIADYAFSSKACEEIEIPDTVKGIGKGAFSACKNLKKINIPNGVKEIGKDAFYGTPWYEMLNEPFSIVGDGVLIKCAAQSGSIILPDGVKYVTDVFETPRQISYVELPDTVKVIGENAFYGTGIKEIDLPRSVTKIARRAFEDSLLENIQISKNVKAIGCCAFDGTPWFKKQLDEFVIVGDGILLAYYGDKNDIQIPSDVRYISSAFSYQKDIKSIVIPTTVSEIGEAAFYGIGISEVNIPGTVKIIHEGAFSDCKNLKKIIINEGTLALRTYSFNGCPVEELALPASLEELGDDFLDSIKINEKKFILSGNSKFSSQFILHGSMH